VGPEDMAGAFGSDVATLRNLSPFPFESPTSLSAAFDSPPSGREFDGLPTSLSYEGEFLNHITFLC
jgi:hypothetical protein